MMQRFYQVLCGLLLALVLSACSEAPSARAPVSSALEEGFGDRKVEIDADSSGAAMGLMPAQPMFAQATGAKAADAEAPPPPPPPPTVIDAPPPLDNSAPPATSQQRAVPLLIYTAELNMAVFETTASIEAVQKLAVESGGYLVHRSDRAITVRVPAAKFRDSIETIGKMGDVLHRNESVQDVTDQFYDLRTRLKNARAVRERLQQLLAQSKDVKDALAVEKELGRVTADIEAMEGKLKRFGELIAFSTITVDFRPRASESVNSNVKLPFPWLNRLGLSQLLSL